jgi:hypothetical protein
VQCRVSLSTKLERTAFQQEHLQNDCDSKWHVDKYGGGGGVDQDLDHDDPKGNRHEQDDGLGSEEDDGRHANTGIIKLLGLPLEQRGQRA